MVKRIIAVLVVFATLFTLVACGSKTAEEISEEASKAAVKNSEKISQRDAEIDEKIASVEEDVGKTEKGKRLVTKMVYGESTIYEVVVFKNKTSDYILRYEFYYSDWVYENAKKVGDDGNDKLIKKDDNTRLLVYKNKDNMELSFDDYYARYQKKVERNPDIFTIVE